MRAPLRSKWRALAAETLREIVDDNCVGLAAQLAFYFLLALFPALLFVVALLGYLPVHDALTELLAMLGAVAPRELITLLYASAEGLRGADTEDYEAVAFIDCCKM